MKITNRISGLAILILSIIFLSACGLMDLYSNLLEGGQKTVEEQVQGTLTAVASENVAEPTHTAVTNLSPTATTRAPTETPTPTELSWGIISGQIAYPSEFIPPQRVVAFNSDDFDTYFVMEVQSGSTFSLEVPPGDYYVLAYVINPSQAERLLSITQLIPRQFCAGYRWDVMITV